MAAEELTVRGLTGVDVALRIAGPGTRSYAFVIDWHIRLLAALAWILLGLVGRLLASGPEGKGASAIILLASFVLAVLTYFLYHPVLEVLTRGRTPGKRMAGVRIVTREGATPGAGALLMRNLFRLIDALPAGYVLGLTCCLFTAQRVRVGDLAAGTVLVLDSSSSAKRLGRFGKSGRPGELDPGALELIEDLLERWSGLEEGRRMALGRRLLSACGKLDPGQIDALDSSAMRQHLRTLAADED